MHYLKLISLTIAVNCLVSVVFIVLGVSTGVDSLVVFVATTSILTLLIAWVWELISWRRRLIVDVAVIIGFPVLVLIIFAIINTVQSQMWYNQYGQY